MNKVAISFSTKDRVELSKQSIEPLLQHDKFDFHWADGSRSVEGERFFEQNCVGRSYGYGNVTGGADAAIVFSLTTMLQHPNNYDYIGLAENDVLLDTDWFEPTMALFEQGNGEGLEVGAVSARCYTDRVLIQRYGYALMHNLGAGHIIFTRKAAELVLHHFRTGHTLENRRTFMQLCGLDIARWNSFVREPHVTTADWQFDRILAQHGLASLALTPGKCQMIGQEPPLDQQGLTLAAGPVEERRNDAAFNIFVTSSKMLRAGALSTGEQRFFNDAHGTTVFPHQIAALGGSYDGGWRLRWSQGFGPFAYVAEKDAVARAYVSGPCAVLLAGQGEVRVRDRQTGFEQSLELAAPEQLTHLAVPAGVAYREIEIIALTDGIVFYGLCVNEPQMLIPNFKFDHACLPPVCK